MTARISLDSRKTARAQTAPTESTEICRTFRFAEDCFAVLQNGFPCRKSFCSTGKQTPVQQTCLPCNETSRTARSGREKNGTQPIGCVSERGRLFRLPRDQTPPAVGDESCENAGDRRHKRQRCLGGNSKR